MQADNDWKVVMSTITAELNWPLLRRLGAEGCLPLSVIHCKVINLSVTAFIVPVSAAGEQRLMKMKGVGKLKVIMLHKLHEVLSIRRRLTGKAMRANPWRHRGHVSIGIKPYDANCLARELVNDIKELLPMRTTHFFAQPLPWCINTAKRYMQRSCHNLDEEHTITDGMYREAGI
ncbi:unnamed protein product [Polarella glacialis]|uniref:Uncharacterized protein n=1 Tax=Polarella glacialis TaxID=89957 RepID=A0A813H2R7_POLGL|nr:unnamed protein product [Polarella glacialis]